MIIFLQPAIFFIKAFVSFALKKPAIILTNDSYIENIQNIKIAWADIIDIKKIAFKASFLAIKVNENSIVYRQVSNPIKRFLMWTNTFSGEPLMTNFSLLKGKSDEIINLIKEFQQNQVQ